MILVNIMVNIVQFSRFALHVHVTVFFQHSRKGYFALTLALWEDYNGIFTIILNWLKNSNNNY